MHTAAVEHMACPAGVLPKRARFTACSPAEDGTLDQPGPRVGGVGYSVIKSMSRFYMLVRYVRERNRLDLNATSDRHEDCPSIATSDSVQMVGGARSPWELGGVWDYNTLEQHVLTGVTEGDPDSRNGVLCTM